MVGVAALVLVAHVSVLQGHANVGRSEGGGVVALRNMPLLEGDTLSTSANAQAEIELDASVSLRLDADTSLAITSLAPHHRDVRLSGGTLDLSAQRNGDSPRIETPSITLAPDAPGLVRIAVVHGVTSVVVRHGTLRILTPNGMQILSPGELVTVDGPQAQPTLHYAAASAPDAFDGFNQTRDTAKRDVAALAAYGSWVTRKPYGSVWQPHEFAGWAPYHSGRWLWRKSIGWTWIARESWGWLPYHGGGWLHDATLGWCWVPPSAGSAPSWAPANAIFFASIVRGHTQSIGWLPLGPGEPFHSSLAAYHNAQVRGALNLIPVDDFYSGDFARTSFPALDAVPSPYQRAPPPRSR